MNNKFYWIFKFRSGLKKHTKGETIGAFVLISLLQGEKISVFDQLF